MTFVNMTHEERMKEFKRRKTLNKIRIFIFGFCTTFVLCGMMMIENYFKDTYTKEALVIYVDENETAVVTLDGNEWSFDTSNFNVEDEVKVTFNTMKTNTIYDDEIIKVKKINR